MEKKELEIFLYQCRIQQKLRNLYGWDGSHAEPVSKEVLCDIQHFFEKLQLQIPLKDLSLPLVCGDPAGGLILEWSKIIKENEQPLLDSLCLVFNGHQKVYLISDLEWIGIKKQEEFELNDSIDPVIVQHIIYF